MRVYEVLLYLASIKIVCNFFTIEYRDGLCYSFASLITSFFYMLLHRHGSLIVVQSDLYGDFRFGPYAGR